VELRNFSLLFLISFILYTSSAIFKIYYEVKNFKKEFIADISNLDNLLNKNYVGTIADSYGYIKNAYGVYKKFKPIDCFRAQIGYVFAPFIFIFKNYFIVSIIFFNSLLFSFLISTFLHILEPKNLIKNLILLFFVFLFTFYYIPRIMLDPIIINLFILALIFFLIKRYNLTLFSLFIASIIRPEALVLLIIFIIFLRKFLTGLIFLIFITILYYNLSKCPGDQTNFLYWSIRGYYENVKNKDWQSAKIELKERCLNVDDNCYKKVLIEEFNSNKITFITYAIKNAILNPIKLLFFPVDKYKGKLKLVYIIISLIYSAIFIYALIHLDKNYLIVLYSLSLIVMIYILYFILSDIDASRFKLYTLPFEIFIISKGFTN